MKTIQVHVKIDQYKVRCSDDRYELRSSFCDKLRNVHKLENTDHNGPVPFMFLGLVQMLICVKYEGSMINHRGR